MTASQASRCAVLLVIGAVLSSSACPASSVVRASRSVNTVTCEGVPWEPPPIAAIR